MRGAARPEGGAGRGAVLGAGLRRGSAGRAAPVRVPVKGAGEGRVHRAAGDCRGAPLVEAGRALSRGEIL